MQATYDKQRISTHAPRTGSDLDGVEYWRLQQFQPTLPARGATSIDCIMVKFPDGFQPTLPARGATSLDVKRSPLSTFQPTLPARGATSRLFCSTLRCNISTHAPRTGSDSRYHFFRRLSNVISTHAPRTGSDRMRHATPRRAAISTHAPRTGSDGSKSSRATRRKISTHAPRTGSDDIILAILYFGCYFNPRSPHGERPILYTALPPIYTFQPTLPARGATRSGLRVACLLYPFQPTLPARGATCRRDSPKYL